MEGPLSPAEGRVALAAARERLRRENLAIDPLEAARRYSEAVDAVIGRAFGEAFGGPRPSGAAVLALGGYGRAELAPFSDIDVLVLHAPGADLRPVEGFVRHIWDVGLEASSAVRTVSHTAREMTGDDRTATTVLESRLIAGDAALEGDLRRRSVPAFLRRHGAAYRATKRDRLAASLRAGERAPYAGEPALKEGPAGLRDVQRILWIERARGRPGTLDALQWSDLPPDRVAALLEAYRFLVRVRCELHFAIGFRQDTLEFPAQKWIARALGWREEGGRPPEELLVEEYARHARAIRRAARLYLELLDDEAPAPAREPGRPLPAGLVLAAGAVRPRRPRPDPLPLDAAELLEPFLAAQEAGVELTPGACEEIRRRVAALAEALAEAPGVARAFLEMARRRGFGGIATALAETGVLERIIPEFRGIAGRIELDDYHAFPVDEHTLLALRELDRLETRGDHEEPAIRKALLQIRRLELLRLAVLLHDVGKALPGPHAAAGGEVAQRVCDRLGLDRPGSETVRFLVHHHLDMNHTAQRRDFGEPPTIGGFAGLVGDLERLRSLYVLTYLDIQSVGPRAWWGWKGAQLAALFERTRAFLRSGGLPDPLRWLGTQAAHRALPCEAREELLAHVRAIGVPGYAREHPIEEILRHVALCRRGAGRAAVQVKTSLGFAEVAVAAPDRPHLLADLVGLLAAQGLTILSARAHSRADGVALDIFHVAPGDGLRIPPEERLRGFREALSALEAGATTVARGLAGARRRMPPRPGAPARRPPAIRFDPEPRAEATVIEISAPDRLGLLYDLAEALSREGLDVRAARVATLAALAVDTFYVLDREGRRITDPRDLARIEEALREAIERGGGAR